MSTVQLIPAEPVPGENRRSHPRRRLERLAYIRFDNDNGGILIDIGEGGLKFHGVASSTQGELCVAKFTLPGTAETIEVRGQIVWSNRSKKGGGVRFVDLPEDVRLKIREWMSQEVVPRIIAKPVAPKVAAAGSGAGGTFARGEVAAPSLAVGEPTALSDLAAAPKAGVVEESANAPIPMQAIAADKPQNAIRDGAGAKVSTTVVQPAPKAGRLAESGRLAKPAGLAEPMALTGPTAVASPNSAEFPRSESFLIAGLDKHQEQTDRPSRSSGVAQIMVTAASVCVVVFAAMVGVSRSSALLYSVQEASEAAAPSPVAVPATSQDFKVVAVDLANRRWILQNGGDDAAASNSSNARQGGSSAAAAIAPIIPNTSIAGEKANRPGTQHSDGGSFGSSAMVAHMDLQRPTLRQVPPPSQIGLQAPLVPDGPSANLLDSHALVASAPQLPPPVPAPAKAQPVAVAKTGFREPVLIHSVQAIYPRDISLSNSGGVLRVSAVIDKEGVPGFLKIVSGDPQLLPAAFAAIREFRYDPAMLDGNPVESTIIITMSFKPRS